MRILLINKYHYLKGGAERAYFDTAQVLTDAGHEVAFFSMADDRNEPTPWSQYFVERVEYGDEGQQSWWRKFRLAAKIIWNREAQKKLDQLLREFRPDVAHLHNIYHQLSPSIIWTLKRQSVPMVMTLHDYKLVCPNYSLFVRGKIWEASKPNHYFHCVSDRCVKDSSLKSLVCTLEAYVHRWLGTYGHVDRYIAPSRFLIEKFREFCFAQPIEYVPQPLVPFPERTAALIVQESPFVFVGRLSVEKGVDVAIRAMAAYDGPSRLVIVGDGPARDSLEALVSVLGLTDRVEFLGAKYGDELEGVVRSAKAVIVPSVWYENMPYTVLEALGRGKWVIASRSGGIAERIVDGVNGALFTVGDVPELTEKLRLVERTAFDTEAARKLLDDLRPEAYLHGLESVYVACRHQSDLTT